MKTQKLLKQTSIHEKLISEAFNMDTAYEGEIPCFNFPLILLAFTNRCGSNYFAELLRSTNVFAGFHEQLNGDTVSRMRSYTHANSFPDHIANLIRLDMKDAQFFGFKASWEQIMLLMRWKIDRMFPQVYILHLRRRDIVGQAISYSIADQTKQWTSEQKSVIHDPKYDFSDIERRLNGIQESNKAIELIAACYDLPYYRLDYEDLTRRPWRQMQFVGEWVGVDISTWRPVKPRIEKQRTTLNQEFSEKYRAEVLHGLKS